MTPRLADQEKLQPLGPHPLQPGFALTRLLEAMLPVVEGEVDLQGFLPYATFPAPIAQLPPPRSPKATVPSLAPSSDKDKDLVEDVNKDKEKAEEKDEVEDKDGDKDEVEVVEMDVDKVVEADEVMEVDENANGAEVVDGDEVENGDEVEDGDEDKNNAKEYARRVKSANRRAKIRKSIYSATEEFPDPEKALDEKIKAHIHRPEVVEAACSIISQGIADDLLGTLKTIGLGADPDGATSRLCELIGKHAGSLLIDEVNLEALVSH